MTEKIQDHSHRLCTRPPMFLPYARQCERGEVEYNSGVRVPTLNLLEEARKGGFAVGAFSATTLEEMEAIVECAEEERSPVILIIGAWLFGKANVELLVEMAKFLMEHSSVPMALHLDHGREMEHIRRALELGYDSAMIDASHLSLEENITATRQVVELLHRRGLACEAELGRLGSGKVLDEDFTDPDEAKLFVQRTRVDALAISIGTVHGLYEGEPQLDFNRLEKIRSKCSAYLVLHGGSHTPDEQLRETINRGITKVNIATDLSLAYLRGLEGARSSFEASRLARDSVKEVVREKLRTLGSCGKAPQP